VAAVAQIGSEREALDLLREGRSRQGERRVEEIEEEGLGHGDHAVGGPGGREARHTADVGRAGDVDRGFTRRLPRGEGM
jgi:hypothetical protein